MVCSMCLPIPCGLGGGKVEILGRDHQCGLLDVLLTDGEADVNARLARCVVAGVGWQPAGGPDRDQVAQTRSCEPRSWRNRLIQPNRK